MRIECWDRLQPVNSSSKLLAVGLFGNRSSLGNRIETLLRRGRNSSPFSSRRRIAQSLIALAVLTAAAAFAPRWLLIETPALAQTSSPQSFDVASIKPGDPGDRRVGVGLRADHFSATNATLKLLIEEAYDVRAHQISGGPNWLNSAIFTIEATPPVPFNGADPMKQLRPMVQTLLRERFQLSVRRETRTEPVYDLVVSKGGHRMKASAPDAQGRQGIFSTQRNEINGYAASIPVLVNFLSGRLGRSVIDNTALTGTYDFKFIWTPESGAGAGGPLDTSAPADTDGPSIFTAIQEQLGLRLESSKGPVEILNVDHAEKPDAN
jgi:uncharacterized protein (TIGR03435 family)